MESLDYCCIDLYLNVCQWSHLWRTLEAWYTSVTLHPNHSKGSWVTMTSIAIQGYRVRGINNVTIRLYPQVLGIHKVHEHNLCNALRDFGLMLKSEWYVTYSIVVYFTIDSGRWSCLSQWMHSVWTSILCYMTRQFILDHDGCDGNIFVLLYLKYCILWRA